VKRKTTPNNNLWEKGETEVTVEAENNKAQGNGDVSTRLIYVTDAEEDAYFSNPNEKWKERNKEE
jgi:hypothetical protein